ncbi:MAG: prepilin peptidase [Lachnospiraceae bacterium]|nr:prepilin peptidase [Lachnospiraceae bacterium]
MQMEEIVREILLLGFLFVAAWIDYKKKELPLVLIVSMGLSGIVFQIIVRQMSFLNLLFGSLIGILFLGIGKITRQALGYGDGFILVATGIFLGFSENVLLLLLGVLLAAGFSIGLMIFRKKTKKDEIPFLPFLFTGYVLLLMF